MITKDQLDLLEKPIQRNEELHYTIGGPAETVVHSSLENERIGQLHRGHRIMNEAAARLERNVAFKSREGLAKGQFQHSAQELPQSDRALAERTWQSNHISAHKDRLNKASHALRSAVREAAQGNLPPTDTDIGYGGSPHQKRVDRYVEESQRQPTHSQRIKEFAQSMTREPRQQSRNLER